jgi:hypothetical protein
MVSENTNVVPFHPKLRIPTSRSFPELVTRLQDRSADPFLPVRTAYRALAECENPNELPFRWGNWYTQTFQLLTATGFRGFSDLSRIATNNLIVANQQLFGLLAWQNPLAAQPERLAANGNM